MPFMNQESFINSTIKFRFGGYLATPKPITMVAGVPQRIASTLDIQVTDPLKNENVAIIGGLIANDTGYDIELSAKIGFTASSSNPGLDLMFRGVVDGVTDLTSEIVRTIGTGNDKGALPLIYTFIVPNGKTLDLEIEADENTEVTLIKMTFDWESKKIFLP